MEKYIVSARKYRPTTFDEVVGQQHVANTLKNALSTNHVAHAYLFTGPRGVGKTTCARILAKVLNCQSPLDKHTACNECESCKSFNGNATFNILELDAASNNSVDHIRALTDQVRFLPQSGKYKVFIIDEVHMLSQAAFNAFLKTLEEPPAHAIFILATTEKHKLLPTILSRCQIFDFKRITQQDIALNLESICRKESISYDKDALFVIAEKADGAMRDALSILDKVISSVDNQTITYKDVVKNLNLLDYDYFFRIVDSMLIEDLSAVLLLFNEISRNGFEGSVFINGLSEHLRQLMLAKDIETIQLLEASEHLKNRYADQAKLTRLDFILSALSIANQCDINYQKANNKQLHIEISLSKMCYLGRLLDLSQIGDPKKKVNTEADLASLQKKMPQTSTKSTENLSTTDSPVSLNKEKIESSDPSKGQKPP
ncbi:MAG TPA: DNA polymerase III subunit gamma/tau, partial [Saprospirales bacterium]|nr:DNA polymerase III subunit gamma/tau [Saprospirales bacterium]